MKKLLVVVGAVLAVIVGTALAADWRFLRGTAERLASSHLGVPVSLAGFRMSLLPRPHLSFEGLQISNPPGARQPEVLRMDQAEVTLALWPALHGQVVIDALALRGGELYLERDRNGKDNWTIPGLPEQRDIRTLELDHLLVSIDDAQNDLLMNLRIGTNSDKGTAKTYPVRTEFDGLHRTARFKGTLLSTRVIGLRDTEDAWDFKLNATSGGTRITAEGTSQDILDAGPVGATVELAGPSLSLLNPFLPMRLPAGASYAVRGKLDATDNKYRWQVDQGRLGQSDFAGSLNWESRSGQRPQVELAFRSQVLDSRDIEPWLISNTQRPAPARDRAGADARRKEAAQRALPEWRMTPEQLPAWDATIDADVSAFRLDGKPTIENLKARVVMQDGRLLAQPMAFFYAGGEVQGSWELDQRNAEPATTARLTWQKARLNRIPGATTAWRRSNGSVGAMVELSGTGGTSREWLASVRGSIGVAVAAGDMPALVGDLLGSDAVRPAPGGASSDRRGVLRCGALWADVDAGRAKVRSLMLQLPGRTLSGSGYVDLRSEALDVRLTPVPDDGAQTLPAGLSIAGSLAQMRTTETRTGAGAGSGADHTDLRTLVGLVETGMSRDGCAGMR